VDGGLKKKKRKRGKILPSSLGREETYLSRGGGAMLEERGRLHEKEKEFSCFRKTLSP